MINSLTLGVQLSPVCPLQLRRRRGAPSRFTVRVVDSSCIGDVVGKLEIMCFKLNVKDARRLVSVEAMGKCNWL